MDGIAYILFAVKLNLTAVNILHMCVHAGTSYNPLSPSLPLSLSVSLSAYSSHSLFTLVKTNLGKYEFLIQF